jgi:hypothetical protein
MPGRPQSVFAIEPKRRSRWPYLLTACALIAGGGLSFARSYLPALASLLKPQPQALERLPPEQQVAQLRSWADERKIRPIVAQLTVEDRDLAIAAYEVLRQAQARWATHHPTQCLNLQAQLVSAISERLPRFPSERMPWVAQLLEASQGDLASTSGVSADLLTTLERSLDQVHDALANRVSTVDHRADNAASYPDAPSSSLTVVRDQPRLLDVPPASLREPNDSQPSQSTNDLRPTAGDPPARNADAQRLGDLSRFPDRAVLDFLGADDPQVSAAGATELSRRGVSPAALAWALRLVKADVASREQLVTQLPAVSPEEQTLCLQWLADDLDPKVRAKALAALAAASHPVDPLWVDGQLAVETDPQLVAQLNRLRTRR